MAAEPAAAGAAPPPGGDEPAKQRLSGEYSLPALVEAFLVLQAERAAHYRRMDSAFRTHLQTKAEGPYRWGPG